MNRIFELCEDIEGVRGAGQCSRRFLFLFHNLTIRIPNAATADETIEVLRTYLFDEQKFELTDSKAPGSSVLLSEFLETRRGSSLCLTILFGTLAEGLGFETRVVDAPVPHLLRVSHEKRHWFIDLERPSGFLDRASLVASLENDRREHGEAIEPEWVEYDLQHVLKSYEKSLEEWTQQSAHLEDHGLF